jgi:hypothetical protein
MGAEVAVMAAATVAGTGAKIFGQKKALDAAKDAHAQNAALFKEMFGKAEGALSPYISRGNTAGDAYMSLLGYGDAKAGEAAFNRYLDSTGYKFQLAQGVDALNTGAANRRLLNSGANLKNISNFGQQMGRQYFNSYLGLLAEPQGIGANSALGLAQAAAGFANLGSDNNDRLATARGGAWINGTQAFADGLQALDWKSILAKSPSDISSAHEAAHGR